MNKKNTLIYILVGAVIIIGVIAIIMNMTTESGTTGTGDTGTDNQVVIREKASVIPDESATAPTQITAAVTIKPSVTQEPERVAMKYDLTLDEILGGDDPMPDFDLDGLINETLQAFRKSASKEEKLALMRKIEDITHPVVIPVIMVALKDPDPEIQQAALEAMRFLDDPAVIPAVMLALENKDPEVREDALSSLLLVKGEGINEPLIIAAKDPDNDVRDEALIVLMTQAEPYVLPALEEIITYEDKEVQAEVVSILEEVPDPGAIELLIDEGLLSDYDEVRSASVEVLRDMSGREFSTHEEWLAWWNDVKDTCPADGDREKWETWWYRYARGIDN
jgi:hypothetical protein